MLLDARTGRTVWERPLPAPARADGSPRAVRQRRCADHLGLTRRDADLGRPDRQDPAPLRDRWSSRALARRADARAGPQQRVRREAELGPRHPRPPHRPPSRPRDRAARRMGDEPGVHARRDADRGPVVRGHARLGRRHRRRSSRATGKGSSWSGSGTDIAIDRRGLAIFTTGDGTITAWDPEGARRVGRVFPYAKERPECLGWTCSVTDRNSTGDADVDGRRDGWRCSISRTKRSLHVLPARDGTPAEAGSRSSHGGRRLATGGTAGTVTIWDLPSRTVVRRLRFPEPVWATAVSPDETLIAVLRRADRQPDAHVEVRDLASGATLLHAHDPLWAGRRGLQRRRQHADRLRVLRRTGRR